jgi:CRISPR-associated endonuclease/helicase Cas3
LAIIKLLFDIIIMPKFSPLKNLKTIVLPLNECLAKTIKKVDGTKTKGVSVFVHCQIVGLIAKELIDRQPKWIKDLLFPKGSELVAAVHDIGKVSPCFQEDIYRNLEIVLNLKNSKNTIYHNTVSQASLQSILYKYIPEIVGRHHGESPESIDAENALIYGGDGWQQNRIKLVDDLKKFFNCDWPIIKNENQANAISGLICVADWIGSGSIFDCLILDKIDLTSELINKAIDSAGFVKFNIKSNLSFENIFDYKPFEIQTKLFEVANKPGVYVLEAPMGSGKTEAALYAAYQCLEKYNATGVYFALPTQLTSDKIYDRMNLFLDNILDKNCKFRSLLLHSSAWLKDTELGNEGMPGKEWFSSKKRGLLAPFAVGTIDQVLMSIINVRHSFVRLFGLIGKIVILDEIHSYDAYTVTIIDELIKVLQEIGCVVIILSATLSSEKRSNLVGEKSNENSYPLISALPKNKKSSYIPIDTIETHVVEICFKNTEEAIDEAIFRASKGQQVLWIENTVGESQDIYNRITSKTDIECGLLHSRFLKIDRSDNEEKWVKIYGKQENLERKKCGHILVGTQVVEQSLDIDADFLVTRFCPTDMLFQRFGRLWRHKRERPEGAKREAWILAPNLEDCVKNKKAWDKTGFVYSPYILCRSLEIWQNKKQIYLPKNIRLFLEETYKERIETGTLKEQKNEIIKEKERLSGLARASISIIGKCISERALTRYSESESNEVFLIKNIILNENETILTLLDDNILILPRKIDKKQCKEICIEIQKNVVSVPDYCAPNTLKSQISWIEDFVFIDNFKDKLESDFKVCIVKENGRLCSLNHGNAKQNYILTYTKKLGFRAQKT